MDEHEESTSGRGLLVDTITNGPFAQNCFVVADRASREALLVDGGLDFQKIHERIRDAEVTVAELANTHAHIDHVGGVAPLQRVLGAPVSLHRAELPWLEQLPTQAMVFGLPEVEVPEVDRVLEPGERIRVGSFEAEVLFTPGHSAGGCSFYFREVKVVFVGDTLFAGSVGRTDLPGGSTEVLLESIRSELLALDDDVTVYCGHGPPTTIGAERRQNPFLLG